MSRANYPVVPASSWLGPVRLFAPSKRSVSEILRGLPTEWDYQPVGSTLQHLPEGWDHDDQSVSLGSGEQVWLRAVDALRTWRQFDLTWVTPHDAEVPIRVGEAFAFVSRQWGVWTVNACRVVALIDDEEDGIRRFGFAYGTVGTHVVRGEEAFLLTWNRSTDEVRFRIRKFSRPAHLLVRLMSSAATASQLRFTRDALARMIQEVTP